MKISIITPTNNSDRFVEKAILSVLEQNYENFEHIIIDNCSTDNTIRILKKYRHLIWISEPDKGQSDALNKGFRMASGEVIGWLNSDEYYKKNAFKVISNEFINNSDIDIVYGDINFVDENLNLIRTKKEIDFNKWILLYYGCYISTAATFFRRKIFDDGNFLDINYHYTMDFEFFVRLSTKGYKFKHINKTLAEFIWSENNKSLDKKSRRKDRVAVQKKYGFKIQLFNDVLSYVYHAQHAILKLIEGKLDIQN